MIFTLLRLYNSLLVFPLRYIFLTHKLGKYLINSKKIIDVGSSNGRLAHSLMNAHPQLNIQGIDTVVLSQKYIPVQKYDGKHIPFKKNWFDTALIVDVLHHDKNIFSLLKEILRVTTTYLVIKDHYYETPEEFEALKKADWAGNAPYGIELPYNYLTLNEWNSLFKQLHLKILKQETFSYTPFDKTKNIIFLLKK